MLVYELRKITAQRNERLERERLQHIAMRQQQKSSRFSDASTSLIQHYNENHDLHEMLLAHGWIPKGRDVYASPFSQSKGSSVYVYGQRAVSFTQSDHGNIGKVTDNGYVTYDSWDVYVAMVHAGSIKDACRAYADESGFNKMRAAELTKGWLNT